MELSPELLDLIYGLTGFLVAVGLAWLKGKYGSRVEFYQIISAGKAITAAAAAVAENDTDEKKLSWALERMQKYLNANGWGWFDARVVVEYAWKLIKSSTITSVEELE